MEIISFNAVVDPEEKLMPPSKCPVVPSVQECDTYYQVKKFTHLFKTSFSNEAAKLINYECTQHEQHIYQSQIIALF